MKIKNLYKLNILLLSSASLIMFNQANSMAKKKSEEIEPSLTEVFPSLTEVLPSEIHIKIIDKVVQEVIQKEILESRKYHDYNVINFLKKIFISLKNMMQSDKYLYNAINGYINYDLKKILQRNNINIEINIFDLLNDSIIKNYIGIAKFLLSNYQIGDIINLNDANNHSLLIHAASKNRREILDLLINAGADINITDKNKGSALIAALENKHKGMAIYLIKKGIKLDIQRKRRCKSALSVAAEHGYFDIAKRIIKNTNKSEKCQEILDDALMYSIHNDHDDITQLLVDNKVNINAAIYADNGDTYLTRVATYGDIRSVKKILKLSNVDIYKKNNENYTALQAATLNNYNNILIEFINHGADINLTYDNGRTLLMDAIKGNNHSSIDIIKTLLENKADVNAKDNNGQTALTIAISKNDEQSYTIIKLLLQYGAKVDEDALNKANSLRRYDIVELLTRHKLID